MASDYFGLLDYICIIYYQSKLSLNFQKFLVQI